jgi:hypothetical protein
LPEATEEMRTLGTPIGSARMAGATKELPPDPPAEITPLTGSCRRIHASKACAIAVIAAPRSPVKTALGPPRKYAATWCGGTSAGDGLPDVDRSTKSTRTPAVAIWSRMNRSSSPLVSSVPATMTGATPPRCMGRSSTAGAVATTAGSGATVRVRAAVSIWATGTGCDQRVGMFGLEIYTRTGPRAFGDRRSP